VTDDPSWSLQQHLRAPGLRALYFVVRGALARLRYLKPGLAAILIFVGLKICSSNGWTCPPAPRC